MAEQEKKGPGRPPNVNFNQDFVEKQDIENIFATVPAGYAIQVHREEPDWCKGYLGKIFCSAEEPINLDMLKNKFGGSVLNLRFVNAQQKFKGSKRVIFPDPPKRDGRVIREGDLLGVEQRQDNQHHNPGPGGGYIPPGLPPQLAAQLAAFYAGYPIQPPQPEQRQNPLEALQATQIMNMMNAQMDAQQQLMKNNMDHMREMEKIRRESEDERERRRRQLERDKPEPMSELQGTIAIIRELNGIKSELGDTNTTTEIISHSAPIVENAIAEIIELQKMKLQSEMARNMGSHPPPLPPRQTADHTSQVRHDMSYPQKNGNGKTDPVELARQLRAAYDGLSTEDQTAVMSAFLDGSDQEDETEQVLDQIGTKPQNIVGITNPSTMDLLSDEDREILADDDEQDNGEEISDGEYPITAEKDDKAHRSSDSDGYNVPTD
jgi:hypothetical protein